MNTTWKAVTGIVLVFILGWLGGVLTTVIVVRHKAAAVLQHGPEAIAIVLERQTTRNLHLNENQKTQLHALFVENVRQRMELQKQIQPEVRSINQQTMTQINALLSTDQQQLFHDNLILFKDRFGRNPFNVGSESASTAPAPTPSISSATNTPATHAPVETQ